MRDGLDILLPKASFSGQVYIYIFKDGTFVCSALVACPWHPSTGWVC